MAEYHAGWRETPESLRKGQIAHVLDAAKKLETKKQKPYRRVITGSNPLLCRSVPNEQDLGKVTYHAIVVETTVDIPLLAARLGKKDKAQHVTI